MVQPTFRLAGPADAYEMAVMSRYLVEVGLRGWSWPPECVAKAVRARSTLVVVAEVRAHLVGFAIMEFGEVQAHLSLFAVKPSYHRCGIGRALMMMAAFPSGRLGAALPTLREHGVVGPEDLPQVVVPADPGALDGWRFA